MLKMKKTRTKRSQSINVINPSEAPVAADTLPHRQKSQADYVTPLDFVKFIPWVCLEWNVPSRVIVIRLLQEEYIEINNRNISPPKIKSVRDQTKQDEESQSRNSRSANQGTQHKLDSKTMIWRSCKLNDSDDVVIHAYYDTKDHLVEISIIGCLTEIPRKVIRAFSLCLPFHPLLGRLTIRRSGLNHFILHEISKLLPHSNITAICLDDSYVPQGNYYVLLQETSRLSYLSLNRCMINDDVCKEIAMNLVFGKPAAKSLHILSLTSNEISDMGAQCLGKMLRSNRCLLHLNLAGNKITDDGAKAIFSSLMEFRITDDEVLETKQRQFRNFANKQVVYLKCIEEFLQHRKDITISDSTTNTCATSGTSKRMSPTVRRRTLTSKSKKQLSVLQQSISPPVESVPNLKKGILGDVEPYCLKHILLKEGQYYTKGNFVLTSLNFAYNNLHYPSLQIIDKVVDYQHQLVKLPPAAGLMRIVLDGNFLPETCGELDRIELHLKINCTERIPRTSRLLSPPPTNRKKSARTSRYVPHSSYRVSQRDKAS